MIITKEELFEKYWDKLLPTNTEKLARSCGVVVENLIKIKNNDRIGVSIIKKGEKYIYIDREIHNNRQRFSVAHQLAHHLLGHTKEKQYDENLNNFSTSIEDQKEKEANKLAIEIMIPTKALQFYMKQKNMSIIKLAQIFNVSKKMMEYRLKEIYVQKIF